MGKDMEGAGIGTAQSVSEWATGWSIRGQNPGRGKRFFSRAHPASYAKGTGGLFLGIKRLGRKLHHSSIQSRG